VAVAAGLLPGWCLGVATDFPELLPLPAREHAFYCAAFGPARAVHTIREQVRVFPECLLNLP
jgi:hypothetical protein